MGVGLLGEIVVLAIWLRSHEAVKFVATIGFLKRMVVNGTANVNVNSDILISLQNDCSKSTQEESHYFEFNHL